MFPLLLPLFAILLAPSLPAAQAAQAAPGCASVQLQELRRNPTERELRCRFGAVGPGRFGLLSYVDVPVYQPTTPMPGTHIVGVPGHAGPRPGESYEEWEWRVLRTVYPRAAEVARRDIALLDPFVGARILRLERRLAEVGVRATRRETWRSPERQAFLFQQGRSRPGPLATTTLTSWHSHVDAQGQPAGRAVDYDVAPGQMRRFHEVVREVGLASFGAESFDPGHVFLPAADELPVTDLVMLRVLPRIPEVTLSTGLPVDRSLPSGGRAALRAEAQEFATMPFIPFPRPALIGAAPQAQELLLAPARVVLAAEPPCRSTLWERLLARVGGGDARCAPRKSGAQAPV